MTMAASETESLRAGIGRSPYQAYAGSYTGGLNGAYWVEVRARRTDGSLLIRNLHDVGRIAVQSIETTIEPDLVYPLLRGRDVRRWRATPSASIILAQDPATRSGLDPAWMRGSLPLTYEYLAKFEPQLRTRAAYRKYFTQSSPFYTMYNVGTYTMAPYKVVWPWIADGLRVAVVSVLDGRVVIPDHNVSFVPVDGIDEADYLCAFMNSRPADASVRARTLGGGGGIAGPSILQYLAIPKYSAANSDHRHLSAYGKRCRELSLQGPTTHDRLRECEEEIDGLVRGVWKLPRGALDETKTTSST